MSALKKETLTRAQYDKVDIGPCHGAFDRTTVIAIAHVVVTARSKVDTHGHFCQTVQWSGHQGKVSSRCVVPEQLSGVVGHWSNDLQNENGHLHTGIATSKQY